MLIMTSNSSTGGEESSSSFTWCCYQVFLCFRGTDVRDNFLECFRDKLQSSGIDAFTDADGIRQAEEFNPKLAVIISQAQVCVPIFSKDFASSKTCLMEVERMVAFNKTILPIFYGVKPHVVRYHLDSYGKSLNKHIEKHRETDDTVNLWKSALKNASGMSGEELSNIEHGYHGLIERVVDRLWELLRMDNQYLPKHLVDIGPHVREVLRKLDIVHENGEVVLDQQLSGKRVVVILGLPGIGKTTLAKAVYNKIRPLYRIRGSCFLHHVRQKVDEGRLISLQEGLIGDLQGQTCLKIRDSVEGAKLIRNKFHNKGVFIVLDDADSDWERIEELMGGLDWLGPGSKVVVTSNKRDAVDRFKGAGRVVQQHEVGEMPDDKAWELFCKHAFQSDSHSGDFANIARRIIPLLGGNPRYIVLVGSFLIAIYNSSWDKLWEEMREKLKAEPEESMEKLLKLIYGKFSPMTRDIFLDIACLFDGMDQRTPSYLWKSRYPDPSRGIFDLWNLSWLKVGENEELQMPELMVLLGKKMVKDEDRDNPWNRSRVWDHEDGWRVLEEIQEQGNIKVKALCLEYNSSSSRRFSYHKLRLLSALRVLRLCHAEPDGGFEGRLPTKLRWLAWKGCREASHLLPFHAGDLLVLDLSSNSTSLATFALQGWRDCIQGATKLKVLNLSGRSVASIIFPLPTSLEQLILERCVLNLSSVNILPNLMSLNIKHCKLIRDFPRAVGEMNSLTEILIDGADIEKITLPRNLMKRLKVLSARNCEKLLRIPEFLDDSSMKVLSFEGCKQIVELPDSVGKLQHLKQLDLSETMITQLNPSFDRLKNLEILRMRRTNLEEFPQAIQSMTSLKEIDFSDSGSMQGECDATSLSSLRILKLSSTRVSHLRMSRTIYCNLEILECDINVQILREL